MQHPTKISSWKIRHRCLHLGIKLSFLFISLAVPWFLAEDWLMMSVYGMTALTCSTMLYLITLVIFLLFHMLLVSWLNLEFLLLYILCAVHIFVLIRPSLAALGKMHLELLHTLKFILQPLWFILIGVVLFRFALANTSLLHNSMLFLLLLSIGHLNGFLRVRLSIASVLGNVFLVLLSSLLGIIALEAGARLLMGPPAGDKQPYIPHPKYVYMPNPGGMGEYIYQVGEKDIKTLRYEINEQGFRDRFIQKKKADEMRILLLGDSFTWGVVDLPFTISSYLEGALQARYPDTVIRVINGGIAGAGPVQALGMLKERGVALEPDWVIMQFFLFNDLDDCLLTTGKRLASFIPMTYIRTFINQSQFPYWLEYNVRQRSRAYAELSRLVGGKELIGDSLVAFRGIPYQPLQTRPKTPHISPILDINREEWYSELQEAFHMLIDQSVQMATICEEHGIKLSAYCIPLVDELLPDLWNNNIRTADTNSEFTPLLAIRRVEELLAASGIDVISVVDALTNSSTPVENLFYPFDKHLNAEGNGVVASAILEHMEFSGLAELYAQVRVRE